MPTIDTEKIRSRVPSRIITVMVMIFAMLTSMMIPGVLPPADAATYQTVPYNDALQTQLDRAKKMNMKISTNAPVTAASTTVANTSYTNQAAALKTQIDAYEVKYNEFLAEHAKWQEAYDNAYVQQNPFEATRRNLTDPLPAEQPLVFDTANRNNFASYRSLGGKSKLLERTFGGVKLTPNIGTDKYNSSEVRTIVPVCSGIFVGLDCGTFDGETIELKWNNVATDKATGKKLNATITLSNIVKYIDDVDTDRDISKSDTSYEKWIQVYSNFIDNIALFGVTSITQKLNLTYADTGAAYNKPFYITLGSLNAQHKNYRFEFAAPGSGVIGSFVDTNSWVKQTAQTVYGKASTETPKAFMIDQSTGEKKVVGDNSIEALTLEGVTFLVNNGAEFNVGTSGANNGWYEPRFIPRSVISDRQNINILATYNHVMLSATPLGDPMSEPKPFTPTTLTVTPQQVEVAENPAIKIVKYINNNDANTAPGVAVAPGSNMNIRFVVTNTGDTVLNNVKVADNKVPDALITPATGFNGTLNPGASTTFTATVKAPANGSTTHTNTGTATGTSPGGKTVTATDPANAYTTAAPKITVKKYINNDDAQTAPGVAVAPGSNMNIRFVVTNTGNVPLTGVNLTDNKVPAASITPTTGFNGTLAPGASTTYTAVLKAPATGNTQHVNTATVTGQPPMVPGATTLPPKVTSTDPANAYTTSTPKIDVIKKINGQDANTVPGVSVQRGSTMNITYEVTNTGNVPLTGVKLSDDKVAGTSIIPATGFTGTLAPGAKTTYTATVKAPENGGAQHKNTATVTGQPPTPLGSTTPPAPVKDDDPAHAYTPSNPSIQVVKKINGQDANTAPGVEVEPGSDMNITYEVTNTGDVPLTGVNLTDNKVAGTSITPATGFTGTLTPGAKTTYTATLKAPTTGNTQHTNTATVTGQPPTPPGATAPPAPVTDTDPANAHTPSNPSIQVIKKINGQDANTAPGVKVVPGSTMNITFEVTNTGNVPLTGVKLSDNKVPTASITPAAGFNGTLNPGASTTYTATLKAPTTGNTQHTNTATVTGQPPTPLGSATPPAPVKDDDPANAYTSMNPAIRVVKKINGDDANIAPGAAVAPGSDMDITFEVTNTGNVTLTGVKLSDDKVTGAAITPASGFTGTLAPGAKTIFTATLKAPEEGGVQHINTATVTGQPPTPVDSTTPPAPVTDDDPANAHTTTDPSIQVIKKINGDDANEAPGVEVKPGDVMDITFEVENTGNVPLYDVKLSDDVIGDADIVKPEGFTGVLQPGDAVEFTAKLKASEKAYVLHKNVATVTGQPPTSPGDDTPPPPVTDDDPGHSYTGGKPGIKVTKLINGQDANEAPGVEVQKGTPMDITFEVVNTGDTVLDDVKLSDDVIGDADIVKPEGFTGTLQPGQKVIFTAKYDSPEKANTVHKNTATVTGQPPTSPGDDTPPAPVEDDDPGYAHTPSNPSIQVIKKINGTDNNDAPGAAVEKGSMMDITFDVTNTGDVVLKNVKVSDNVIPESDITPPEGFDGSLKPGETVQFTAKWKAPEESQGVHHNVGKVTGQPPTPVGGDTPPPPVEDEDDDYAHVPGKYGIKIVKFINGDDANEAPGVEVEPGSMMDVTFDVTNTGDVVLKNVKVSDNVIPAEDITPPEGFDGTLKPGETVQFTAKLKAPKGGYETHMNVAKAVGTPPPAPGSTTPPEPVEDDDPANSYTKGSPKIEVIKKINGDDANDAPGVEVEPGSMMDITFDVTNTGDVVLKNVKVSDDVIGDSEIRKPEGFDGSLKPGETVQFTAKLKAPTVGGSQHKNVALVTGTPVPPPGVPTPPDVTDDDPGNAHTPEDPAETPPVSTTPPRKTTPPVSTPPVSTTPENPVREITPPSRTPRSTTPKTTPKVIVQETTTPKPVERTHTPLPDFDYGPVVNTGGQVHKGSIWERIMSIFS